MCPIPIISSIGSLFFGQIMDEEVFTEWFETNKFYIQNNGKVRDGGNRIVTIKKILERWDSSRYLVKGWFAANEEIIGEYIESNTPKKEDNDDSEPTLAQRRQMFRDKFFETYEVVEGESFYLKWKKYPTGKPISISRAVADIRGAMADNNVSPPSKEDCVDIITGLIFEATETIRLERLEKIRYNGPTGFDFKAWTKTLLGLYKIEDTALNRRMFKHMVHQVKRAGFSLFTNDQDFMYLFYSKVQGIGKSRLISHLAKPFYNGLNDSANLNMLCDDNSRRALFDDGPAIIDFKEMGLSSKGTDNFSASIKQFMDLKVFKTRQMFADFMVDTHAYAVWMSSTNLRVEEVIKDTDYRRFYSFDVGLTAEDKAEYNRTGKWREIDKFFDETLLDAYRSLDENEEPPEIVGQRFDELCEVQASYATRQDTIQIFLNDRKMELFTDKEEGTVEIPDRLVYSRFKEWAKTNGIKQYSILVMETLIAQSVNARVHTNGKGERCYWSR